MKIKLISIFFLALLGGVSYFAYPLIKSRYFQSTDDLTNPNNERNSKLINPTDEDSDYAKDELEDLPDESTVADDVFIEIDTEDCEDNCEQFEDEEDKKYCQEYCGLTPNTSTTDDCEKLTDLERDYCFKNKALKEKSFTLCKKITDQKLLESCKNQLTENLMNNSNTLDN